MIVRYIEIRDVIEHLPLLAEKKERKKDSLLSSCNVETQRATNGVITFASSSLF